MSKMITLSKKFEEAFTRNKVKAADLQDGQELMTFRRGTGQLVIGTACRCDECPNVGVINAGVVLASTPESALYTITSGYSNRLDEDFDVGCYDEDGSGDVLCRDCRAKREQVAV